jgi:hypothetical protein
MGRVFGMVKPAYERLCAYLGFGKLAGRVCRLAPKPISRAFSGACLTVSGAGARLVKRAVRGICGDRQQQQAAEITVSARVPVALTLYGDSLDVPNVSWCGAPSARQDPGDRRTSQVLFRSTVPAQNRTRSPLIRAGAYTNPVERKASPAPVATAAPPSTGIGVDLWVGLGTAA